MQSPAPTASARRRCRASSGACAIRRAQPDSAPRALPLALDAFPGDACASPALAARSVRSLPVVHVSPHLARAPSRDQARTANGRYRRRHRADCKPTLLHLHRNNCGLVTGQLRRADKQREFDLCHYSLGRDHISRGIHARMSTRSAPSLGASPSSPREQEQTDCWHPTRDRAAIVSRTP